MMLRSSDQIRISTYWMYFLAHRPIFHLADRNQDRARFKCEFPSFVQGRTKNASRKMLSQVKTHQIRIRIPIHTYWMHLIAHRPILHSADRNQDRARSNVSFHHLSRAGQRWEEKDAFSFEEYK